VPHINVRHGGDQDEAEGQDGYESQDDENEFLLGAQRDTHV